MIDSLKGLFDTIRKECDFKTVEDYNRFIELGVDFLEKFNNLNEKKSIEEDIESLSDVEYKKLYYGK